MEPDPREYYRVENPSRKTIEKYSSTARYIMEKEIKKRVTNLGIPFMFPTNHKAYKLPDYVWEKEYNQNDL